MVAATPRRKRSRFDAVLVELPRRESGGVGIARRRRRTLPLGCRVDCACRPARRPEWGDTVRARAARALRRPACRAVRSGARPLRFARRAARLRVHVPRRPFARIRARARVLRDEAAPRHGGRDRGTLSPRARVRLTRCSSATAAMSPETDARLRGHLVHLLALSGTARRPARLRSRAACAWPAAVAARWAGALRSRDARRPILSLLRTVAARRRLAFRAARPARGRSCAVARDGSAALLAWQPGWRAIRLPAVGRGDARVGDARVVRGAFARWPRRAHSCSRSRRRRGAARRALLLLARFTRCRGPAVFEPAAVPLSELLLAAAWLVARSRPAVAPRTFWPWLPRASAARARHSRGRAVSGSRPALLPTWARSPVPAWLPRRSAALLALTLPETRTHRVAHDGARARAVRGGRGRVARAMVSAFVSVPSRRRRTKWFVAVDVGQGDALQVIAGRDGWWMVDRRPARRTGTRARAWRCRSRWAEARGVCSRRRRRSHGGARAAVSAARGDRGVRESAPRLGSRSPRAGNGVTLGVGTRCRRLAGAHRVWSPRPDELGRDRAGDNAAALVLEVGEGNARALPGDGRGPGSWRARYRRPRRGGAQAASRLRAVRVEGVRLARFPRAPRFGGRRNAYGHPHRSARAVHMRGAVDRTDRSARAGTLDARGARLFDWRGDWTRAGSPRWRRRAANEP